MSNPEVSSSSPAARRPQIAWPQWLLLLLPLGWLWGNLLHNLWPEWDTNPQYSYGLVVPILVVGLLLRRVLSFPGGLHPTPASRAGLVVGAGVLLALAFLPTRLIEGATPEWRPLQWSLAVETIGLTLGVVYLVGGKSWLRQAAFPLLFFLVAIPWPSLIEQPVIQGLSRLNTRMVVEVLGIIGVPAIAHGNVIEISTGVVGVNDACSGIRSVQSSLMISLFIGEFYRFRAWQRLILVPVGLFLAMALNLFRATLLTWIAAKEGIPAIAKYHDQAGLTILLICTVGLLGVGWLMNRKKATAAPKDSAAADPVAAPEKINFQPAKRFAIGLLVWLAMVEAGVEGWYRIREARLQPGPAWTVAFPENDPTYREVPLAEETTILLQFDAHKQGQWTEPDGTAWQAYYFHWNPGRVAGYLAKRHTPEICLTATGFKMTAGPRLRIITVHGVDLPMRAYTFQGSGPPLQIFQCHWEAGQSREHFTADEASRFNLVRAVWAGRGNQGQKVLEVILSGYDDMDQAEAALVKRLETLIQAEPPPATTTLQ
jgi:exosortase